MKIIINPGSDVQLSDAFKDHIRDALRKVEQRYGEWLTRTEVFLTDATGPRDGVDKHCRLEARPRGSEPLVAEHQDADFYNCVSRAADKLETVLERRRGQLTASAQRDD